MLLVVRWGVEQRQAGSCLCLRFWHGQPACPPCNQSSPASVSQRHTQTHAHTHLFDSRMPAPPVRKRQLGMSMDLSFPKYQFWVMFSVLSTSAVLLG